jgi:glycerophosphoryl diester phosphodiesterase
MSPERPLRIAHAYGNSRARIRRALDAGVDLIETDLRWDRGTVWVRHEHRLGWLPILYNRGLRGIHTKMPFGLTIGRYWLRADVRRLRLEDVVAESGGAAGLLLDFKAGRYRKQEALRFVDAVFRILEDAAIGTRVAACGHWPLLELAAERRPNLERYYSIDSEGDWERFQRRSRAGRHAPGASMKRDLVTPERAAALRGWGTRFVAWDIDTAEEAEAALAAGARGVIADNLEMLTELEWPAEASA